MKQLVTKSVGLAIGVALVAPLLMAPAAVNGSLGGFTGNAPGGQNASDWGIPQDNSNHNSSNQNHSNQNSQSDGGQSAAAEGQAKSGDGSGQSAPGEGQTKGSDGGNQNGAGDGQTKSGDSGNQNGDGGNQNGTGEGQTKGGDGGNQSGAGEDPIRNPMGGSVRTDDGGRDGGSSGGDGGHGSGSGSGSHRAHSGQGGPGDYPALDPTNDGQYDPSNNNDGNQVPSGCAEAGSQCAQCVQRNENVVQFNRRYLHVAWSTTHQAIDYANKAIAFGDAASGIHSTQALAWQLAGKPQITEALTSLRRTYDNKYHIYINNMEEALNALNECEQDNFAVRDLYARFSSLYLEFVKARYQSPD